MGSYLSTATSQQPEETNHGPQNEVNGNFNTPVGFRHIPKNFDPRSPTERIDRTPLLLKLSSDAEVIGETEIVMSDPRSPSTGIDRTPLVLKTQEPKTTSENAPNEVCEEKKVLEELFDSFSSLEISSNLDKPVFSEASDSTRQLSDSLRVEPPSIAECTFSELEQPKLIEKENSAEISAFPDSIVTSTPIKTSKRSKNVKFDKENENRVYVNQKTTPQPYKRTPLADKRQNFDSPKVQLQYQQKAIARVLMQQNSQ